MSVAQAPTEAAAFELGLPASVRFGFGVVGELAERTRALAERVLLVTGANADRFSAARTSLQAAVDVESIAVTGEPTVEDVIRAVEVGRQHGARAVVALGGGSALDMGKAVAALLANPEDPLDFLEVVGKGLPLRMDALPVIAVPTTAGTGSEVTKNAVLHSTTHHVKASLRHPSMLPRVALVDPELTFSMSKALTAATGLDALTQCLEPYVSHSANPFTDGIALEGLRRGVGAIRLAVNEPLNRQARGDMALCSLFGGLSLANAKLGAVHGLAAPIGGRFKAPHGAVCARLLPLVMHANIGALQQLDPAHPALARYTTIARLMTQEPTAVAADGVSWVASLVRELGVPGLAHYGMTSQDVGVIAEQGARASSMRGNPLVLPTAVLEQMLHAALADVA
jgi:alcohol dehydrogenase class IV